MTRICKSQLTAPLAVFALTLAAGTQAHGQLWTAAGSGDWNTTANWNSGLGPFPNSASATVNFLNSETATVNISSSVSASTLNFANATGNYAITSSANQILNNLTAITVAAGVTGTEMINLANINTGSLLFPSTASLIITNNSAASTTTLVIGPNTVIGTPGSGGIFVFGAGTTQFTGSFAVSPNNENFGLEKSGPGTLIFSGNGSNMGGGFAVDGGSLVLDYSTNPASKLGAGLLALAGGVLSLTANTGTPITQTISGNTSVQFGQTDIKATGTGTITLAAGSIARNFVGATIDVATGNPPTFAVTTSTGVTNGLLGTGTAFATTGGWTSWATVASNVVTPLNTFGTTFTPNINVDVTASQSPSTFATNSLRFNSTQTLTLSGTNTLQSGGILVTPSGSGGAISGGSLTAPSSGELLVFQYGTLSPFTINSALVSTAGLTKTGPGTLTLGGNNTGLTGPINVNRGNLTVTNAAAVNSASLISFNDSRTGAIPQTFTADLGAGVNGAIGAPIDLIAFNASSPATVFSTGVSGNSRVTLSGAVNSISLFDAPILGTPFQFTGSSQNTSGFNLTNIHNTFLGNVTLLQGFLGITADACLGDPSNTLILDTTSANAGGLEFLNGGVVVAHSILVTGTTRVVSDGSDSNTISGTVSSNGSSNTQFVKGGTGTLRFIGNGNGLTGGLTLNGGTLALDYSGNTASKLGGGILTLNGGVLTLIANAGIPVTQTIPNFMVVNSGHTDINAAASGIITLGAGNISYTVGATVDFGLTSGVLFNVTTTTGNTAGVLGNGSAYATVNGGSTWATVTSGAIAGLPAAGYTANFFANGINTDVTMSSTQASNASTFSLRFNTGNPTVTLAGTNQLFSGGVLVNPLAAGGTITGGTITAGTVSSIPLNFIVHQYSAGSFTINSALSSTAGLTKTGPGMLILGGNNAGLTGPINVNRGGITATTVAAIASASAINFNDARPYSGALGSGGLQQFTVDLGAGVNGAISAPIRLSAFGAVDYGTYFSTGASQNSTVTLSGVISSPAGLTTSIAFTGSVADTSGLNLTNTNNTFTGNVSLLQGSLGIMADSSLGNAANTLTLNTNDASNGGLVFLTTGVTVARPLILKQTTRIVSNGTDSNTITSPITGAGGLVKDGSGTLTISSAANSFTGGVTVNAGTLTLGATGNVPAFASITVVSGATFSPGTTSNTAATVIGTVALNGGTFRVSASTGQQFLLNEIVTGAAGGTVDYTGAGADQLVLAGNLFQTISVAGNSTWLSPANGTTIVNGTMIASGNAAVIPVTIPPGVTFTNGIALATSGGFGFVVSGGGTLFQNSDATNVLAMSAPVSVAQGVFRVTDASSNGGVGNLGTGTFTLGSGTLDYAGGTAATAKPITVNANDSTVQIEAATSMLTETGAITGSGGLTKTGPGTLVLGSASNTFTSLTIVTGSVQTANDNTLGAGPVTIGPFGTLTYTGSTTTARTFTLNSGTLAVAAGQTLTLNGAAIGGGFLSGAGTFATGAAGALFAGGISQPSVVIISNSAADQFINFSNSAAFSMAAGVNTAGSFTTTNLNGFTNQGLGSMTIGAGSQLNVANFQSYGMMNLTPATVSGQFTELANLGTAPLGFNGGSQTFIGTAAAPNANVVGVDLHGQNMVIQGGLFVNNGLVFTSTGSSTILVDYGATYKGAGTTNVPIVTQNGGKVLFGNCPGVATFGNLVLGTGGINNLEWEINDAGPSANYPNAPGVAGPTANASNRVSGWSLGQVATQTPRIGSFTGGNLTWTATPSSPFGLELETLLGPSTLSGTNPDGPMADFDPTQSYTWPIITYQGAYSGPTSDAELTTGTLFDRSLFANALPAGASFDLHLDQYPTGGGELDLIYTPSSVPEPGTLALVGAATAIWLTATRNRRRRSITSPDISC